MKSYRKFITTGCSFTTGYIPVKPDHNNDLAAWREASFVWPHFVYSTIATPETEFFNFAIGGGSNRAAMNHLIQYLELHPDTDDILVGFNITALGRQDLFCDKDNDESALLIRPQDRHNEHDVIKILNSSIRHATPMGIGIEQRSRVICNASEIDIIQAISYLEAKGIDYFFMFMSDRDYAIARPLFRSFVEQRPKNWVRFGKHVGMAEYIAKNGLSVSDTDLHPNRDGHELIAKHIIEFLENG